MSDPEASLSDPRVSILLPAYQAANTLDVALRSVLRQRETSWECVVIDDGSRDQTLAIARDFERRDDRVRVLSQQHVGIVAALNTGLELCRAPWVARMDADDWMHRDRLALQLRAVDASPNLSGVGCHVRIFPRGESLTDGSRAYESWLNAISSAKDVRREAFVECPIAHPTWMLRRRVLQDSGWRDAGWAEDYDLLLRWLSASHELAVVPRRLLGWRDTSDRLSRASATYAAERFTACKAAFLAEGFLAKHHDYTLWGYGGTGRALRRALQGHGKRPSHIVELHPRRIGQRIHGAPVVEPDGLRSLRGHPIVASVSGHKARTEIRAALDAMGFRETVDYICAA